MRSSYKPAVQIVSELSFNASEEGFGEERLTLAGGEVMAWRTGMYI